MRNRIFFPLSLNYFYWRHINNYVCTCMYKYNVYISRLRGLCTFLLTLLLYWKCLVFSLFIYFYTPIIMPFNNSLCAKRMCHDCCEQKQLAQRAFAIGYAHVCVCCHIHCWWSRVYEYDCYSSNQQQQ